MATYECNPGYTLNTTTIADTNTRTCSITNQMMAARGVWSGTPLICESMSSVHYVPSHNTIIWHITKSLYYYVTTVTTFVCPCSPAEDGSVTFTPTTTPCELEM